MKKFRDFLKKKSDDVVKGVFPNYVHGAHASLDSVMKPVKKGVFPNYVHGAHATKDVQKEETEFEKFDDEKPKKESRSIFNYLNKHNEHNAALDTSLGNHYDSSVASHPDVEHVHEYTSASGSFNRHLIDRHIDPKNTPRNEYHEDRAKALHNVINAHEAPHDFTVHSGLGFDPARHVNANNEIHSPAFLSTSLNPNVAYNFTKTIDTETGHPSYKGEQHILRVKIPKGSHHGVYVNGNSRFGRSDGEKGTGEMEFLMKPGKFKINPTPQKYKGYGDQVVNMWDAEYHPADGK
jgi:hypothetical protein